MKRIATDILRILGRAALLAVLSAFILVMLVPASAPYAAEEDKKQELTIEVVEEIPAQDIEEQAVPLAAGPDSEARDGVRHACLMGIVLLAAIAYALYFTRYERRLVELRNEAADLENRVRGSRTGTSED